MTIVRRLALGLVLALTVTSAWAQDTSLPDLDGQEVQVTAVWTDTSQASFEAVLAEFEARTGADVTYSPAGGDIGTVVGTQIEGGNPPDIAILPQPGLLTEFARRGSLRSVEDIAGDLVDEYYAQVWRDLGTVDGTLHGVWFKAANKSLVWYNADIFEQAGVQTPETWDEWMNVAETLDAFGVTPFSVGGASAWTLTDWFENVYIRSAGPETYDQLTAHEIPWTDPSVVEALEHLEQVWGRPDWLAGGVQGTLEATHPTGIIQPFLDPPNAAMAYGADFSAGAIINETDAEIGETAQFFSFPSIDGSPPAVVGGGDVAVLFTENEAAEALIRFLASPSAAEVWAPRGGYTSPNQGVDVSLYPSEVLSNSARALQNAEVFRFDMSDLQPSAFGGTSGQGLFGNMQEFVRNPDPEAVAEQLENEAAQAFGD
jgi:ABC-type glycerol-3-phosphate transport system substrate-binding protein